MYMSGTSAHVVMCHIQLLAGSMLVHMCPATGTFVETRQDSFHVRVADTVGCGDSFAAAVRMRMRMLRLS
jgi:sugar/nucleoside kinase (ribokinase family)